MIKAAEPQLRQAFNKATVSTAGRALFASEHLRHHLPPASRCRGFLLIALGTFNRLLGLDLSRHFDPVAFKPIADLAPYLCRAAVSNGHRRGEARAKIGRDVVGPRHGKNIPRTFRAD